MSKSSPTRSERKEIQRLNEMDSKQDYQDYHELDRFTQIAVFIIIGIPCLILIIARLIAYVITNR